MKEEEIHKLIASLLRLPKECEWVEFKTNLKTEEEIGKYISALSNGACLHDQPFGYLVFGINDETLQPDGTKFRPKMHKVGKEELEHWLMQRISPRIDVVIYEIIYNDKLISLFQIQPAHNQPTCFSQQDFIRIGSITRSLKDFPEKEKKIWIKSPKLVFEKSIAKHVDSSADIIKLLDTQCFFDLIKIPYPTSQQAVIDKFISEKFIVYNNGYDITNLAAILFAKDLEDFDILKRKAIRVVQYNGKNKIKTLKDQEGKYGYAVGFAGLIKFINDLVTWK